MLAGPHLTPTQVPLIPFGEQIRCDIILSGSAKGDSEPTRLVFPRCFSPGRHVRSSATGVVLLLLYGRGHPGWLDE